MRSIRIHTTAAVALLTFSIAGAMPASAQSAKQVLEAAAERYEQRMQGIENYTLVQDVMGMETTMHFEKETVAGRPVFVARSVRVAGQSVTFDDDAGANDPYRHFPQFMDRAKHGGREVIDGRSTHRIIIEDFTGLDFHAPGPAGAEDGSFEPRRMAMYIDAEDQLLRRMEMEGDVRTDGRSAPVTVAVSFEDYRTTDGLLHHWKSTMITEGLADATGMSPAERAKTQKQLADLEKQMESMPAAQRQMMERMMGSQLEKLRGMLESGRLEVTTQVSAVRVNQGVPQ